MNQGTVLLTSRHHTDMATCGDFERKETRYVDTKIQTCHLGKNYLVDSFTRSETYPRFLTLSDMDLDLLIKDH